jgi:hypothetical protein
MCSDLGCVLTCVWSQGEVSVWYPVLAFWLCGRMRGGRVGPFGECRGQCVHLAAVSRIALVEYVVVSVHFALWYCVM